jgi:hypothetical protein
LSFVNITSKIGDADFSGLLSSRASVNASAYLRNHKATATQLISDGNDVYFCPNFHTIVCPSNACLSSGQHLQFTWDAPATCDALGSTIQFVCRWAGGVVVVPATYTSATKQLSCPVPTLPNIPFDSLIVVEIDMITSGDEIKESGIYMGMYSVTRTSSALENTQLMIRYVNSTKTCGCSALPTSNGLSWYELFMLYT